MIWVRVEVPVVSMCVRCRLVILLGPAALESLSVVIASVTLVRVNIWGLVEGKFLIRPIVWLVLGLDLWRVIWVNILFRCLAMSLGLWIGELLKVMTHLGTV